MTGRKVTLKRLDKGLRGRGRLERWMSLLFISEGGNNLLASRADVRTSLIKALGRTPENGVRLAKHVLFYKERKSTEICASEQFFPRKF